MISYTKKAIVTGLKKLKNDETFQSIVKEIKPGKFERSKENMAYQARLAYTKALRDYAYNPLLLDDIFSDSELKELFFRTFGYQGQMNFTIYPNAWFRDLPLLEFGEGAYLGDGIVLGTNQVSIDQEFINVDTIKIGARTVFDQRGAVGYESVIGDDCSLRFDVSIGIKCKIGNHVIVGEKSFIGHGTKIGNNVNIGQGCSIGNMCIIDDDLNIKLATVIPEFSHVTKDGIANYRSEK